MRHYAAFPRLATTLVWLWISASLYAEFPLSAGQHIEYCLVGVPCDARFFVSGGRPPYRVTLRKGRIPPGMTMNAVTGEITGIPEVIGGYHAYLTVTDAAGAAVNSLSVVFVRQEFRFGEGPVTLTATAGSPFTYTVPVSGFNGRYLAHVDWKDVPVGLNPETTANAVRIQGVPRDPGQYNFTVELEDSTSQKATQNFSVTVRPALSIISSPPPPFPRVTIGAPFGVSLIATGGAPPYTWQMRSGALPPGVSLSETGSLEGSPAAPAGSYTSVIEVADSAGATAILGISITTTSLGVANAAMPAAVAGRAYFETLRATGGQGPYNWSVSAGSLPPGLRLLSDGTVIGMAAEPGTYEFGAQVTDGQRVRATARVSLPVKADETTSIDVLHAATLERTVAGATWVSLFGRNLAPHTSQARAAGDADLVGGQLPVELDGITVRVGTAPARLSFVSPDQINALLPEISQEGSAWIEVSSPSGIRKVRVPVLDTAPGLFTFAVSSGDTSRRAAFHTNGAVVTPDDPARPGETVVLYGAGLGPTNPPSGAGEVIDPIALASSPLVLVGGVPAEVQFAGRVSPGLCQINVKVPALAKGQHPLRIEIGGRLSQTNTDIDIGVE